MERLGSSSQPEQRLSQITSGKTICVVVMIGDLEGRERYRSCSGLLTRTKARLAVFPRGGGGGGDSEALPTLSTGKRTECMSEALLRRPSTLKKSPNPHLAESITCSASNLLGILVPRFEPGLLQGFHNIAPSVLLS